MPLHVKRPLLALSPQQRSVLNKLTKSRSAPRRKVERAKILLAYSQGHTPTQIHRATGASRPSIYKCIDKALAAGVNAGLSDRSRRPKPKISDEAKAWVIKSASHKPRDYGLDAERWTLSTLARHIAAHASQAGFDCLKRASKATIWRILAARDFKLDRARHYLQQRAAQFKHKTAQVLIIRHDISSIALRESTTSAPTKYPEREKKGGGRGPATATTFDASSIPGASPDIGPDTLTLLAAMDLRNGHIIANVERKHGSTEFIALLDKLDKHFPKHMLIRVVLDNHNSHFAKETRAYLASRPGRFEYIHSPEYGSWLNLTEQLFTMMMHTILRHTPASTLGELKQSILANINEINSVAIRHRWMKVDFDI